MTNHFSRTLLLLRQEKGLNQRTVAQALGVSQALMSHYENGAREPGLAFVVKACNFYEVSADFLLGRSMLRDGALIREETLPDAVQDKGNRLLGSAAALLSKKLAINAIGLIFDLLGTVGGKDLIVAVSHYIGTAIYTVFRHIYQAWGSSPNVFFSVPPETAFYLAQADMALSEANMAAALKTARRPEEPVSHETLSRQYPAQVQSLLTLAHQAGERSAKL